jgi:succinate-semialdehyde dehydrogenase/glutarate-semialdehyde dehydrogenase
MPTTTVAACVETAHKAFVDWRRTRFETRVALMRAATKHLEQNSRDYAELMAAEMGKTITDGHAEIDKCAWMCRHYAEHAQAMLTPEMVDTDAAKSYVSFQPLGVILALMPWNYPFWQVFRFAAPTLMVGNAVLLKHASNVTGCSLSIESISWTLIVPIGRVLSTGISPKPSTTPFVAKRCATPQKPVNIEPI